MKYGYHSTDVDPETIKTEGFHSNNPSSITFVGDEDRDKFTAFKAAKLHIPENPCWIFNAKVGSNYAGDNDYCLKIDITGLKLWPDLNYLNGKQKDGIWYVEATAWLSKNYAGTVEWLEKNAEKINIGGKQLYKAELKKLSGEDCFKYIGSAIIDGDKVKDRIVDY